MPKTAYPKNGPSLSLLIQLGNQKFHRKPEQGLRAFAQWYKGYNQVKLQRDIHK